jgi:hypothetical protein
MSAGLIGWRGGNGKFNRKERRERRDGNDDKMIRGQNDLKTGPGIFTANDANGTGPLRQRILAAKRRKSRKNNNNKSEQQHEN